MQYILDDIKLDLNSGLIFKNGNKINIRAKTLLVLKFLIENKQQIVSKKALLTQIWSNVVVQEQVLVQSIKEIRDVLGSDVIKTYPRQGYQWTAPLQDASSDLPSSFKFKWLIGLLSTLVLLLSFFIINYTIPNSNKILSVAILPVNNEMPDLIHDWVPLQGMDYLNQNITTKTKLNVINNYDLLDAIGHSDDFSNQKIEDKVYQVRKNTGADLIVSTSLMGYPHDFQLHYIIYSSHSVERGVEFADSVTEVFDKLTKQLAQRYSQFDAQAKPSYISDFSNEAFVSGIEHYLQREYIKAMPFFSTALSSNPNLLAARRYLAACYTNTGDLKKAKRLLKENILLAQNKGDIREEIRDNLMIGYLFINWPNQHSDEQKNLEDAKYYIENARKLAEHHQDKLFIAYSHHELGKIYRLKKQYVQAIKFLNSALEYHQSFKGSYGQTTALIDLALVSHELNDKKSSEEYFSKAMDIAEENGVATNKVWILLAQADIKRELNQRSQVNELINKAMEIAQLANSDHLIYRVKAWSDHNPIYEVN